MGPVEAYEPLTLADFQAAGVALMLAEHPGASLPVLSSVFGAAAERATGNTTAVRALVLLQRICWMTLQPGDRSAPFGSVRVWSDGSASPGAQHLHPRDLGPLVQLAEDISHVELRARLADLAWTQPGRHRIRMAALAIEAYTSVPLDSPDWPMAGQVRWRRALQLALTMRNQVQVERIIGELFAAFTGAMPREELNALGYLIPLQDVPIPQPMIVAVAEQLMTLASRMRAAQRYEEAQGVYRQAIRWRQRAGPDGRAELAQAQVFRAQCIEDDADQRASALARQGLYQDAIGLLREVHGAFHDDYAVDAAIMRLRYKLNACGPRAVGEMTLLKGPPIDFSDATAGAVMMVSGKSALDALLALTCVDELPNRDALLKEAADARNATPLMTALLTQSLTRGGRVVATSTEASAEADDAAERCVLHASAVAATRIAPALDQIHSEHAVPLEFFEVLAAQCPVVPAGRSPLFAKGLYAGFRCDLVTALPLLVPQFEHLVRDQLQRRTNALTTTLQADGANLEVGLSALIARPEMVDVFGEDLTFAIAALLTAQAGPNLRNQIAHGLADVADLESAPGLYVWWMVFRVVLQQWWHVHGPTATTTK